MRKIRYDKIEADVLYAMVETYHYKKLNDMFIALAHYIYDSGREELSEFYHDYRLFWTATYKDILPLFPDYEAFKAAVEAEKKKRIEKEAAEAETEATDKEV